MGHTGIIRGIAIAICAVAALACFGMAFAFAFDVSLAYPDKLVNVAPSYTTEGGWQFAMRCDAANDAFFVQSLLKDCGTNATYRVKPGCFRVDHDSYFAQSHCYAEVSVCPSGSLPSICARADVASNRVVLLSMMMVLVCVLLVLVIAGLFICY